MAFSLGGGLGLANGSGDYAIAFSTHPELRISMGAEASDTLAPRSVRLLRTKHAYGVARFARNHQTGYMIPGQRWQRNVAGASGSPGSTTSKNSRISAGISSGAPH